MRLAAQAIPQNLGEARELSLQVRRLVAGLEDVLRTVSRTIPPR